MSKQRECLECSTALMGRVDKKFCNDQCRNSYNNRLLKQDAKIDVIHKLFNSIKHDNKETNEMNKETINTKKIYDEIENNINDKYSIFVERITNIITQYYFSLTTATYIAALFNFIIAINAIMYLRKKRIQL